MKKRAVSIGFLAAGCLLSPAAAHSAARAPVLTPGSVSAQVVRVIDGDTIVVGRGIRVRYIGIDAPETHHPRRPRECLGPEATEMNRRLVEGKTVLLVRDVREEDRYGRLLRYVYLPAGGGRRPPLLVNEELVARGLARAKFYPPDLREKARLLVAQRAARRRRAGIWGLPPRRTREINRRRILADPARNTYHLPGAPGHERLRCRPGVPAFSSVGEAEAAGFRREDP